MKVVSLTIMFFISIYCRSQYFPVNGQLASTAFPVCGTDTFKQITVPIGNTHNMSLPDCAADSMKYPDINPFWYSFTCFKGGTLGFLITPSNPQDDYDWMIYDVTGHDPDDAYTTSSLIVTGNWAGTPGLTGARNGGSAQIKCASFPSDGLTTFSSMPMLTEGHHYLLFISHYNQTQSGYSLYFSGGTAIISDSSTPGLQSANMLCDGKTLMIVLNKKMKCSSLAGNGSDFTITAHPGIIISATSSKCSHTFNTDSINIALNTALAPGDYSLTSQTGTDGNTLLDDCGNILHVGESIHFTVTAAISASFSSSVSPGCNSDTIHVSYSPGYQVNQWEWLIVGTNFTSLEQEPSIVQRGLVPVILQHIVSKDACIDTVSRLIDLENSALKASFTAEGGICPQDLISFRNTSSGDLVSWLWNFDDGSTSEDRNPVSHLFPNISGGKIFNISLIVENSIGCYDTVTAQITKLQSCAVGVPNAFTPNGDGLNDYLYPLNAVNVTNIKFRVFNRFGQLIFESRDGTKKWDGRLNGQMQPAGTYAWILSYSDVSGRKINETGSTVLIR